MGSTNPSSFVGLSAAGVATAQNWEYLASDSVLLVTNGDPWQSGQSGVVMTAGTVYIQKQQIRVAITATNIIYGLQTVGVGASTGSFVGLYSSAGTLLSGSADIATQLTTATGMITCPLTTPQALAAGTFVWTAVVCNLATTQAALFRGSANNVYSNGLLTAAAFRFAANGTGLTALPASITPASNVTSQTFWSAIT